MSCAPPPPTAAGPRKREVAALAAIVLVGGGLSLGLRIAAGVVVSPIIVAYGARLVAYRLTGR